MQEVMFQISLWRWVPAAHGLSTLLRGLAVSRKTQYLLSCEEEEFVCQKRSFWVLTFYSLCWTFQDRLPSDLSLTGSFLNWKSFLPLG